jgi:hypothetical protein
MAGGRHINDHAFWAGKGSDGSVFPKGVHTKEESSAEGAGMENDYEDTTEAIRKTQVEGAAKIKARPLKSGYRN